MLQLFSLLFFSIIFNEANAGLLIKTYIELLYFTSAYNIILLHRFFGKANGWGNINSAAVAQPNSLTLFKRWRNFMITFSRRQK